MAPANETACRGLEAEQRAARFLVQQGLVILEHNFRCRRGELDLIAQDGNTLVFVEVRWRTTRLCGGADESIDRHKQRRLVAAARVYLMRQTGEEPPCRFDAVLMDGEGRQLRWLKDVLWL